MISTPVHLVPCFIKCMVRFLYIPLNVRCNYDGKRNLKPVISTGFEISFPFLYGPVFVELLEVDKYDVFSTYVIKIPINFKHI